MSSNLHCANCGYAFFPGSGEKACPSCASQEKRVKPVDIDLVKEQLDLSEGELGKMFGYKNARSFHEAARRPKVEQGVVELFKRFRSKLLK